MKVRWCVLLLALLMAACGGGNGETREDALDDVALDQFTQAGGDPNARQPISYFLEFPSRKAADRAMQDLVKEGFAVDAEYTAIYREEGDVGWLVVEKIGTLGDLVATEAELEGIAKKHGGRLDGWEAAP